MKKNRNDVLAINSKKTINRITSIDFFRFYFMLQVCLWHLNHCMGYMKHGYIAVEFFFILSGYLLYKSCVKENALGVFYYSWDKLQRFYPEVLIVTIPTTIVYFVGLGPNPIALFNSIFLLQNTGIYSGGGVNLPLWYINVLLLGGGIVYAVLYNYRRLAITIVFPLLVLMVYTYILNENDGSFEWFAIKQCFYIPLWRGMAGLCLGCLLARFHEIKLSDTVLRVNRLLDFLFLMSIVGCLVCVFTAYHLDRYALFFYSIIILCCFTKNTLANKVFSHFMWKHLGQLSFEMLLVHMPIAWVIGKIYSIWNFPVIVVVTSYISLILLSSMLLKFVNRKFLKIALID